MTVFFIYGLTYQDKVFYVGCSRNPAVRLCQHIDGNTNWETKAYIDKVKNKSEISIRIFEIIKHKKEKVDAFVSQIEHYWINKFIIEGHPIKNRLIKVSSKVTRKYLKQLICKKQLSTPKDRGNLRRQFA